MELSDLWSTAGLFYSESGHVMPKGQRSRVALQEITCKEDVAAAIEVAGRIGLHSAELEQPIFDELFVLGHLDTEPKVPGFHLILGWDVDWLKSILGDLSRKVLQALENLSPNQGLISIQNSDGVTYVTVSGACPSAFLTAVRSLVSNGPVHKRREGEFIVGLKEMIDPVEDDTDKTTSKNSLLNLSLHDVFTENGIYQVYEDELNPTADVSFRVNSNAVEEAIALTELAGRITLSAGYVKFPLTVLNSEESWERNAPVAFSVELTDDAQQSRVYLQRNERLNNVVIAGTKTNWIQMVRQMIENWFNPVHEPDLTTWRSRFDALSRGTPKDLNLRARVACTLSAELNAGDAREIILPEQLGRSSTWWKRVLPNAETASLSIASSTPLFHKEWSDSGELDDIKIRILNLLAEHLGELKEELSIEIFTTVSRDSFHQWARKMVGEVSKQTPINVQFIYRSAHKSALVWALDTVLPQLKEYSGIEYVTLQAREYCSGSSQVELRQRYLQEYYPLDEMIAVGSGLSLSNINLELTDSGPMFQIVAKDKDGWVVKKWEWEALYESSNYLPAQPQMGTVLIPQAGYRVFAKNHLIMTEKVPTNPERFWRWYQNEVLPEVKSAGAYNQEVPKFSRLECVVSMDAEEVRLGIREENISVLEALHEDIYFYGLHTLHEYGKEIGDESWDAPGAILPFVNRSQDCLSSSATLYPFESTDDIQLYSSSGRQYTLQALDEKVFKGAAVVSVTPSGRNIRVEPQVLSNELLDEYLKWIEASVNGFETNSYAHIEEFTESSQLLKEIMYSQEVEQWVQNNYAGIPGNMFVLERSFQGRKIHLIELYKRTKTISSKMKHALYKPTLYINARHHANEVSSTNAALLTTKTLSDAPEILEYANVVLTPLENPDGAELHRLLAEENPFWKHHSARYNACGLEFAKHHFDHNTVFGESRVYSRVWDLWKPDVILDDHGVPSHEWVQMFSGFNSPPRFPVSYWLPIAQMYTIWYHLENGEAAHDSALSSLRKLVTQDLQDDRITSTRNSKWLYVYQKWGNAFEPEKFPVEVQNGSIIYSRPVQEGTFTDTLIARYPRFVTAELITEVDDETVHGDRLSECIHAHHTVHESLIQWVQAADIEIEVRTDVLPNGRTRIGINRKRPIG